MQLHDAASPIRKPLTILYKQLRFGVFQLCFDRSGSSRRLFSVSSLVLLVLTISSAGYSQVDPSTLEKQSIERIDGFIENFRRTGDFQSLLPQLQQAEADLFISYRTFLNSGDVPAATLSLLKLATAQRLQQKWQQAHASFEQAYELGKRTNDIATQAKALNGFAMVEINGIRNYDAALAHVEESISLNSRGIDKKALFDALDLKSTIQDARGELVAAADTMNRAHAVATELNDPVSLYFAFFDRANIYQRLGSSCDAKSGFESCYEALERAKSDFDQSLAIARKLGYNHLAREMERFISRLEARRQLLQSEKGVSETVTRYRVFNPTKPDQVAMSEQFLARGQIFPPGSEQVIQELIRRYSGDAVSYNLKGLLQLNQGQDEAAAVALMKAVELLEADRRSLREGIASGSFLEDKIEIYYYPMLDHLDHRRYSDAFDLMERSKSRAMADLLRTQELKFKNPTDRKLYADLASFDANIAKLQKELFNLRSTGAKPERSAVIDHEIQRLEAERRKLISTIASQGSRVQELTSPKTASLAQLQQAMQQDRFEVLSYVVLKGQVVLWHIGPNTVNVRSVFLPRAELIRKIQSLRKSLTDSNAKFDEQTAIELFLFLVQPALQWIKTDHLVIIPHDELNYIPFQVFRNPADNQFLGEHFRLSYAPNATTILQLKRVPNVSGSSLLAVADPAIIEAQDEVEAIGKLHSGRTKIVSSPLIDETTLKAQLGDYNVVHLSVHGVFNAEAPLLSHLKVSKGATDDGMLTAAEMFGLTLTPNTLVVLSACDTGQAQATRANEINGIVRALLYAGANNLVLSSWSVDAASTALWMETFYKEAESKPLTEAARLALLSVKKNPQYSHPYYWGPFRLIGK